MRATAKAIAWVFAFAFELTVLCAVCFTARAYLAGRRSEAAARDVRVDAPAAPPRLSFACELATEQLESLFSKPDVIADLADLRAGVSLSLMDLSPGRAGVVRRLNAAGIPVTAWLSLLAEQGYYLNAFNAPEAVSRYAAIERWSREQGLRWAGMGLDIEPDVREFEAARQGHWPGVAVTLARRYFDTAGVTRARNSYAALIRRMNSDGYKVDTYQFPFLADERAIHTTVLERMLGLVDVRGDREVTMIYTSFNHAADSAPVWEYGRDAQTIAVGSTAGDGKPGSQGGPLDWDEFTRDVLVASQFSPVVGVYSLEGCVRQGFLARLKAMNWNQPVTITAAECRRVLQLRARVQSGLWTASRLPYLAAALLLVNLAMWRRASRRP